MLSARTISTPQWSSALRRSRMLSSLNCSLIFKSHGVILFWHVTSLNTIIAPFNCSKGSFHFVAAIASFQLPKVVVSAFQGCHFNLHLNLMDLDRWWENNFSRLNPDHRIIDFKCLPMIWPLCMCTARIKSWVGVFISQTPQIIHFCCQYSQKKLFKSLCF